MDIERFSALVADIYDAALDPPLWRKVLKAACIFVRGGPSASLFWEDGAKKTGRTYFVVGGDPRFLRLYWDKYLALNPLVAAAGSFAVGELYSATDIIPAAQFVETPFYKEWMAPQGWGDILAVNLDKSATGRATFMVARHASDGVVDDDMRRRMRMLVPHVRRAVIIGKLIESNRIEAAALADTLDGLEAGMFLVDSAGRLVHANASGRVMLNEGNVLHANGKVVARDAQGHEALRDVFSAVGHGDASLGPEGIAVQLTARGGGRFVTNVLPLTSGARRQAGVGYAAAAAVFVQRSRRSGSLPLDELARQYALTAGEVRVLDAMIEIGGVPETSHALKLSPATVRTHLRHVFEKTGVRRQADLVKLIASYPPPILAQVPIAEAAE
jgi:DNA-binding CsgD family transcriptional regulator